VSKSNVILSHDLKAILHFFAVFANSADMMAQSFFFKNIYTGVSKE